MDSEKLTPEELTEEELTEEEPTEEELEEARRRLYAHLAQAEEDIKAGRVHPLDDAIDEIIRELDTYPENAPGLTDDEKIDIVAARILKEYKAAFEELGK
ncbi:unknown [Faecalibacterium sp. CAG:74]|nr:unknown [Faecalibacterium sp. CAG:74]